MLRMLLRMLVDLLEGSSWVFTGRKVNPLLRQLVNTPRKR